VRKKDQEERKFRDDDEIRFISLIQQSSVKFIRSFKEYTGTNPSC